MRLRHAIAAVVGAAVVVLVSAAPANAHPLGNFTINHYDGLKFELNRVTNFAVVDMAEIPTSQLGPMASPERSAYARTQCAALAKAVRLTADGRLAKFAVDNARFGFRPGVAGLETARLECRLSAPIDLRNRSTVAFTDEFQSDRVGWHEIVATGANVHFERSPVPAKSVSDELRNYPNDLLSSPLDVRSAVIRVVPGAGASTFAPGVGVAPSANLMTRTMERINVAFNDLVGRRNLTLPVGLLAIGLSMLLGASHAVLPGHGKTVMAAYLAGKQGTSRDAFLVGATVTITHTAGVMALGLGLTLSASLAGDAVLGWLGVASGVLVSTLGFSLLLGVVRRRTGDHGHSHHAHGHSHGPHGHDHGDAHSHAEEPARVSRRGLIGMGFAGGLVPSPSALVVLLAATALGRTLFGIVLVLGYGLGMAATLTLAGLILVKVRDRLEARNQTHRSRFGWLSQRWIGAMPLFTAVMVIIVGVGLAGRSLGGLA
ncbi:MAG TPA: hypothetical protein VMZ22_09035 [Acidimicrobiales bacterium]|nr:hypothetical protein [Acidimicrobiales bacterium]